jgi:hypothetical protein
MTEDEMVGALREIIEREFGAGAADEAERRCMTPQWRAAFPRNLGACERWLEPIRPMWSVLPLSARLAAYIPAEIAAVEDANE